MEESKRPAAMERVRYVELFFLIVDQSKNGNKRNDTGTRTFASYFHFCPLEKTKDME